MAVIKYIYMIREVRLIFHTGNLLKYIQSDNAMGSNVKLKCPTQAWAYLHFINIPTFSNIRTIISLKIAKLF